MSVPQYEMLGNKLGNVNIRLGCIAF